LGIQKKEGDKKRSPQRGEAIMNDKGWTCYLETRVEGKGEERNKRALHFFKNETPKGSTEGPAPVKKRWIGGEGNPHQS